MENLQSPKRRVLLFMPLLVIPFVTLGFWALGGGRDRKPKQTVPSGLNLQLPEAHPADEKGEGKLAFYEQAQRDSAARREEMKKDPFLQQSFMADSSFILDTASGHFPGATGISYSTPDPNESRVYQKLSELNRQLSLKDPPASLPKEEPSISDGQVQRMQRVLDHLDPSSGPDPQMQQLNSLMDKVLQVRQAQLAGNENPQLTGRKDTAFQVNRLPQASISTWDSGRNEALFLGLDNDLSPASGNSIPAEADLDQRLVAGSEIRLRLLEDVYVHGQRVPSGSFVFARTSLSSNRLMAEVLSIRCGNSIYPVQLEVYDMDGLKGISVPGSPAEDLLKQSTQNGLQTLDAGSLDPSVTAQVASAGIRAAKSIVTQRSQKVKVWVKDGYRLLLRNKNENLK